MLLVNWTNCIKKYRLTALFNNNYFIKMDQFYTRKNIDSSTIELTITIPRDSFEQSYGNALKQKASEVSIKGFRKGKVPANMVEEELGDTVRIETLDKLLPYYFSTALQKENITPIAPPDYKDFPVLKGSEDIKIVMNITVMPEFKLGDLKKIKVEKEDSAVSDKEVDDALNGLLKNNNTKTKEINDEWAKEIAELLKANGVTDLASLKKYVTDTLKSQKEHMAKHKTEDSILEQAISLSKIEIPQPAVKYEASERENSFNKDMASRGVKVDDFLNANNLTIEKMRELWEKDATKALQTDVFLRLYTRERELQVTDEDLAKRIEEIKKTAPADTDQSIFENEEWKEYIRRVIQKDLAFQKFSEEVLGKKE